MFSVHTTPEKFENEGFALKTHQMFSVHTTPEEFENEGFALKTHQMFSVDTTPKKFLKRRFHSENVSDVFHLHYAGGILKRNKHRPFRRCV